MINYLLLVLEYIPHILFYALIGLLIVLYLKDRLQNQHAILKTHPLIGRMRYILEMLGPELRQYLFNNDREGKPIDRDTAEMIAKAGKYGKTVIGFGSKKDFSIADFYLANSMYPKNVDELRIDNETKINTYKYKILKEGLVNRKEKRYQTTSNPYYLKDEDAIVIGENCEHPFRVKGQVGVSAMSYGALSKSAVKALAQGVAISGGSFMNTGEGSISSYHLSRIYEVVEGIEPEKELKNRIYHYVKEKPNSSSYRLKEKFGEKGLETVEKMVKKGYLIEKSADLIFQVGSGLYGARDDDGNYSESCFLKNALKPEVKAIEIKMAQGAKVRGGKLPKEKITKEISEIRGVPMGKDVDSPNRFPLFQDNHELFDLIDNWRNLTGKPIGIKVVAGNADSFESLAKLMKETGRGPDYIAIDGGQGGTGATYLEMADSLGLPIYSGLLILDQTLKKYGVRHQVKIIASGMLSTPNKMAIALGLGADLIYIARAAMNTIGCINAMHCHSNHCPVGVTSHLPHLEAGLAVQEKRFRTANYLVTMRESLFMLGASCGIESPILFDREHITYNNRDSKTVSMKAFNH